MTPSAPESPHIRGSVLSMLMSTLVTSSRALETPGRPHLLSASRRPSRSVRPRGHRRAGSASGADRGEAKRHLTGFADAPVSGGHRPPALP